MFGSGSFEPLCLWCGIVARSMCACGRELASVSHSPLVCGVDLTSAPVGEEGLLHSGARARGAVIEFSIVTGM